MRDKPRYDAVRYHAASDAARTRMEANDYRLLKTLERHILPRLERETKDAAVALMSGDPSCVANTYVVNNWLRRN